MKITQEHYEHMKSAMLPLADKIGMHRESIRHDPRIRSLDVRVAWDIARAAGLTQFICDTLYTYCDDSHITTALVRIVKGFEAAGEIRSGNGCATDGEKIASLRP